MRAKTGLKQSAINLRRKGLSYSEIIKKIPVAKSTLSTWLREISLNIAQKNTLNSRIFLGQRHAADAKRKQRLERTATIKKLARSQIRNISKNSLHLMGIMLYWAEGSKQRGTNIGQQVSFTNSDPLMCKLFVKWAKECLEIANDRIVARIYIHESQRAKTKPALKFWSREVGIPISNFRKLSLTRTLFSNKNRRHERKQYYGILRVNITKSADLNRKISGWIEGVCVQSKIF